MKNLKNISVEDVQFMESGSVLLKGADIHILGQRLGEVTIQQLTAALFHAAKDSEDDGGVLTTEGSPITIREVTPEQEEE